MSDFIKAEQRTLDMLAVGTMQVVQRELLEDAQFVGRTAEVSWATHYLGDLFSARLRAYVLAEHVQDDHRTLEFDWPANWWQHLKLALKPYIPKRFQSRWLVRLQTTKRPIDLKVYYTYPDARIALPKEQFGESFVFAIVNPARDRGDE